MDESGDLTTIREIRIHGGKASPQKEEIRGLHKCGCALTTLGFRLLDSALVHAIRGDKGTAEHT